MAGPAVDRHEPTTSHPDGRPYPWLSTALAPAEASDSESFLVYQPFAGMCNQFSCLECAVAIARATGRTLVLPRWRPQYGWPWLGETADYFEASQINTLVRTISIDEFAARRGAAAAGSDVCLVHLSLEYNPTWSDRGFELYPALRSLLHELEYFALLDDEHCARLGCASPEARLRLSLPSPLRGGRAVAGAFGSVSQRVLALDHCFNTVALPSMLDAGERAVLASALRPNARLRARLDAFAPRVQRPSLAAHVRRTDHWRLAELMGDARYWPEMADFAAQLRQLMRERSLRAWLLATDCSDAAELAVLHALPSHVDSSSLAAAEGGVAAEDGVATALLDMHLCVAADFFVGTRGSMYTEYIQRFRVADGKVVDHAYFEPPRAAPTPASAEAAASAEVGVAPLSLAQLRSDRRAQAAAASAAGGEARGGAVLGLMQQMLPPDLRTRVLSHHPQVQYLRRDHRWPSISARRAE